MTPDRVMLPPGTYDLFKILKFSPARPAGRPGQSIGTSKSTRI
jgi:hypothetical protein